MVLMESFRVPSGSPAHDFSLKGVDDRRHCLADFVSAKVLVIVFMCNHCPYVQACISRLVAIAADYAGRGVQFVGINSNDDKEYPEDSFDAMKIFAKGRGMNFPYLRDDTQEVARAYQAQCTPDLFVYKRGGARQHGSRGSHGDSRGGSDTAVSNPSSAEFRLVYHGRIDDNWKDEKRVVKKDLRDALDAILDEREVSQEQFPSMGCGIKWRQ